MGPISFRDRCLSGRSSLTNTHPLTSSHDGRPTHEYGTQTGTGIWPEKCKKYSDNNMIIQTGSGQKKSPDRNILISR